MAFVPEGQADSSQARSAWESVPRKYRPVGYGMIGRSQSQRYFSWKWAPCRIGAHTCTNHTVPYGTALWVGATQALRAWLRSCCPSGTKPIEAWIKLALMGFHPGVSTPGIVLVLVVVLVIEL